MTPNEVKALAEKFLISDETDYLTDSDYFAIASRYEGESENAIVAELLAHVDANQDANR